MDSLIIYSMCDSLPGAGSQNNVVKLTGSIRHVGQLPEMVTNSGHRRGYPLE